jgi:hypothetical protein
MSNLTRDNNGKFPAVTFPGGYPIVYFCADGGVLCPACANKQNGSEASEDHEEKQWRLVGCDVYWEGASYGCDHCEAPIESAYGPVEDEDACGECGRAIPSHEGGSIANKHHDDSCSLFVESND